MMSLLAQIVPGVEVDPSAAASGLVDAISSNQWGLVVGFAIMLLVWLVRIIWSKLPTKYLPWFAVLIGGLSAFGAALVVDSKNWIGAILAGTQAGLAAAGTWGLLGVLRKKEP